MESFPGSVEITPPPAVESLREASEEVVHYKLIPPSQPSPGLGIDDLDISRPLVLALKSCGITRLYQFQEEAVQSILEGKDVIISAPTASGKTEAFTIPIYQSILERGEVGVQALVIYPNKTLSRDQLKKLRHLARGTGIGIEVYDGDTGRDERSRIRSNPPNVLITNFDMIHFHLSRGTRFSRLIESARFVVIDEIHTYKGAFGSNVHFILKRMKRVFRNRFQIIGASATIRNPKEFASALFGSEPKLVLCERGKHGPLHFFMMYPEGRSDRTMLADVLSEAVRGGMKTVLFSNSHKGVESLAQISKERGNLEVEVHRAGLSYSHRRKVEDGLRKGNLQAVISTPTLELGVDIGDLDAVASELVGITSFKQRIGRVARRGQQGLAVLGLRADDPISSYYRNHPQDYFRDVDPGYCEPRNPVVASHQIISAAMDRPIGYNELPGFNEVKNSLESESLLDGQDGGLRATAKGMAKLEEYSIRGMGQRVEILHSGRRIGFRHMPLAARELHPGAVYLHGGERYRSESFTFDGETGRAEVTRLPSRGRTRTEPKRDSSPRILEIVARDSIFNLEVLYCRLMMREKVVGYYTVDIYEDRITERNLLEDPIEYDFPTLGLVFKAPEPGERSSSSAEGLVGSYHALEHVLLESSDMLTGGGSREIGGVTMGSTGVIFAYDAARGGTGISRLLFERFEEALRRSHAVLVECGCEKGDGCPNCTYSFMCGNNNKPLDKPGAISSLEKIMDGERTCVPDRDYSELESVV